MSERSQDRTSPPDSWTLGLLAGGRSVRMGRDKATLTLGATTMLEHVAVRCAPPDGTIIVAGGAAHDRLTGRWPVVPDVDGAGPLAGIHALCRAATTSWLAVVACDMPYLGRVDLETLLRAARGQEAAFFGDQDGLEPLPLVVAPRSGLRACEALAAAGRFRVLGLAERLSHGRIPRPDDSRALSSVNTPEDLDEAVKFFASLS